MRSSGRDFILLLLLVCAAVNILFYSLSGRPEIHDVTDNVVDIDLDEDDVEDALKATGHGPSPDDIKREGYSSVEKTEPSRKPHNNDLERQENDRIFQFQISNYQACVRNESLGDQPLELVIIVISAAENFLRRHAIRNTWGSMLQNLNATLVYLVGTSRDPKIGPQIRKEAELFSDIVQVNLKDSYDKLTLKSIAMLQWLNDYCSNSKFFLKADDDVFVNVPNLITELQQRSEKSFFMCHVFKDAPPIRNKFSKWFVSEQEFGERNFPTYCSGTAYAFSSNIISQLYKSVSRKLLFRMEDVFITGIATEDLDIEHVHHGGFSFSGRDATGCAYENAITGHKVTTKQMYIIYSQLQSKEIDCDTGENKYIKRKESEY